MFTTTLAVIVGYCIAMWILVFCIAVFTSMLRGAHPAIILWAPAIPFWLAFEKGDEFLDAVKQYRIRRISRAIVSELRANGIHVRDEFGVRRRSVSPDDKYEIISDGYSYLGNACEFFADVPVHQYATFQAVCGAMLQKYPKVAPRVLFSRCYPQEPLDRDWARKYGSPEYFAEEFYVPCEDCGIVEQWHSLEWGDDASHALGWSSQSSYSFRDNTKPTRHVSGHICRACSKKMNWSGSSGSALRKVAAQ